MSKKKLSRTVIEGGRSGSSKYERRHSYAAERRSERDYCAKALVDPEYVYEDEIERRVKAYKDFDDKLGPMYRWLHSQVGRVWNDVKSEIHQTYSTTTTAGRHIVYDHLLSSVQQTLEDYKYGRNSHLQNLPEDSSFYDNEFYVDTDGILCVKKYVSRKKFYSEKVKGKDIAEWLNGRIIGNNGGKLYWCKPTSYYSGTEWRCHWGASSGFSLTNYYGVIYKFKYDEPIYNTTRTQVTGYVPMWREPFFFAFRKNPKIYSRQDAELSKEEVEYFNSFSPAQKQAILFWSPFKK